MNGMTVGEVTKRIDEGEVFEVEAGTPPAHELEVAPFETVGDNIVVEELQRENVTEGGVFLPDTKKQTSVPEVVVVGVGPGARVLVHDAQQDSRLRAPVVGDVLIIRKHEALVLVMGDDERELKIIKPAAIIGFAR